MRKSEVYINCQICEKQIITSPCYIGRKKYCSKQCQFDSRKGKSPWNKGRKIPNAHLNLGKLAEKGAIPWNKGKKLTPKHIEKLRKSHLGQKAWNKGKEWELMKGNTNGFKMGMKTWNKGLEGFLAGDKHYNWKGGITLQNQKERASGKYAEWRRAVFQRDNYLCVIGGKDHGNKLNADHIKPWALYPELRFEISNGRTLCKECHVRTETYGNKRIEVSRNIKL